MQLTKGCKKNIFIVLFIFFAVNISLFPAEAVRENIEIPQSHWNNVQPATDDSNKYDIRGRYLGFNAAIGSSGIINSKDRKPHIYFSGGASYLNMTKYNWLGILTSIEYRKFYLKNFSNLEYYDFVLAGVGFIWNIKNFLIILPGCTAYISLRNKPFFPLGFYAGLGYIFRINKKILLPVQATIDMMFADKIVTYNVYLRFDILFKL